MFHSKVVPLKWLLRRTTIPTLLIFYDILNPFLCNLADTSFLLSRTWTTLFQASPLWISCCENKQTFIFHANISITANCDNSSNFTQRGCPTLIYNTLFMDNIFTLGNINSIGRPIQCISIPLVSNELLQQPLHHLWLQPFWNCVSYRFGWGNANAIPVSGDPARKLDSSCSNWFC